MMSTNSPDRKVFAFPTIKSPGRSNHSSPIRHSFSKNLCLHSPKAVNRELDSLKVAINTVLDKENNLNSADQQELTIERLNYLNSHLNDRLTYLQNAFNEKEHIIRTLETELSQQRRALDEKCEHVVEESTTMKEAARLLSTVESDRMYLENKLREAAVHHAVQLNELNQFLANIKVELKNKESLYHTEIKKSTELNKSAEELKRINGMLEEENKVQLEEVRKSSATISKLTSKINFLESQNFDQTNIINQLELSKLELEMRVECMESELKSSQERFHSLRESTSSNKLNTSLQHELLVETEQAMEELKSKLIQTQQQMDELKRESSSSLSNSQQKLSDKIMKIAYLETKLIEIEQEQQEALQVLMESQDEAEQYKQDSLKLQTKIFQLETSEQTIKKTLENEISKTSNLANIIETMTTRIKEQNKQLSDYAHELTTDKQLIQSIQESNDNYKTHVEKLKTEVWSVTATVEAKSALLAKMEQEQAGLCSRMAEVEAELSATQAAKSDAEREVAELKEEVLKSIAFHKSDSAMFWEQLYVSGLYVSSFQEATDALFGKEKVNLSNYATPIIPCLIATQHASLDLTTSDSTYCGSVSTEINTCTFPHEEEWESRKDDAAYLLEQLILYKMNFASVSNEVDELKLRRKRDEKLLAKKQQELSQLKSSINANRKVAEVKKPESLFQQVSKEFKSLVQK